MTKVTRLLIAAMGGEGGGVLTGWIVGTLREQGLAVQATSVPGVAQRTGATTYYIEFAPYSETGAAPNFALTPVPGGVDVVVATELLEGARMAQLGFVTPERTFFLGSTHRVLTVPEKSARGDGSLNAESLVKVVQSRSRDRYLFDMGAVSRTSRAFINSVALGAMVGLELLPGDRNIWRNAVGANNQKGFDAGATAIGPEATNQSPESAAVPQATPAAASLDERLTSFPEGARDFVRLGIERLNDYQNEAYARRYLDRLEPFKDDPELVRELSRNLAVRMSYEDIVRVAQLKAKPGRMERIRSEIGADSGEPFEIREFFKPRLREIADMLPPFLGRPISSWTDKKPSRQQIAISMRIRTTTILGYTQIWLLSKLRWWRPLTLRYTNEQAAIDIWLSQITAARGKSRDLALQICHMGRLVKGYGDTHDRARQTVAQLAEQHVNPVLAGNGDAQEAASALSRDIAQTLKTH